MSFYETVQLTIAAHMVVATIVTFGGGMLGLYASQFSHASSGGRRIVVTSVFLGVAIYASMIMGTMLTLLVNNLIMYYVVDMLMMTVMIGFARF